MDVKKKILDGAKKHFKRIVLPESTEPRNLKAADRLIAEKIAQVILIGSPSEIKAAASQLGLANINQAQIVDPSNYAKLDSYADTMVELRKSKGLTKEKALEHLRDPLYLATLMIKCGDADGEVTGAIHATGDVLRPALQFVKTLPGISIVSGAFLMIVKDTSFGDEGLLVFADCAVFPDPDERQLAEIAVSTARTAKAIAGIEPRVAMLSFSTKGSAEHALVTKVVNATKIAREMDPTLLIDGELQADAAIVASVGKTKCPDSQIAGKANVLIFPDLQSGNIGYKLVQRLAGAEAIGPILQGMAAPINDLSRGCSADDIFYLVAITANQAAGLQ
jgi:phosphate acetyltransferase